MNKLNEKITSKGVIKTLHAKGMKVFTDSSNNYNLNIVNIRSNDPNAGKFDDSQIVFWFFEHKVLYRKFDVTVDPGIPYLLKPLNPKGAAIVFPGQYFGVWKVGMHKGKYKALVQADLITVYRDNNKDNILDFDPSTKETGMFGINCHRASSYGIKEWIGYYSAGCCVHKDPDQFAYFIELCQKASIIWGNSFTGTWLTEEDYDKYNA